MFLCNRESQPMFLEIRQESTQIMLETLENAEISWLLRCLEALSEILDFRSIQSQPKLSDSAD